MFHKSIKCFHPVDFLCLIRLFQMMNSLFFKCIVLINYFQKISHLRLLVSVQINDIEKSKLKKQLN